MLRSMISVDSSQTMIPDVATPIEHPSDPELLQSVEEVVKAILDFMEIRYSEPCLSIRSKVTRSKQLVRYR